MGNLRAIIQKKTKDIHNYLEKEREKKPLVEAIKRGEGTLKGAIEAY